MRRSAGFKYMTPSQVNIPSTHKLTILHLQPELITAFFLRHTSARGERVHGSLIPPPSLWPGRELRKYHYLSTEQLNSSIFKVRECGRFASGKSRFLKLSPHLVADENAV